MNLIDRITQIHIRVRSKQYEKSKGKMSFIAFHNRCHNILLPGIRVMRRFRKEKIYILHDKRPDLTEGAIYACTHIGGFDIETLFEAIQAPCWLFLADPREIYINFDGLLLWLNGVICFESDSKSDRLIAKEKAINLLKAGGSLMIFPEGAWNIYHNMPIMPLYWGCADMAIQSNTPIIPVAVEIYDNCYIVNIGECINVNENDDKVLVTNLLSEKLSTLKWEIWERQGIHKRCELLDVETSFLHKMFNSKNTSVTIEDVLRCRYYPKNSDI